MQAKNVMTRNVVTVRPETPVAEIAEQLLERRIGAVPVVDSAGQVIGIVVSGGVAHLWGAAYSEDDKAAIHVAAESTPGVKAVEDNVSVFSPSVRAAMWAE